MLIWFHKFARSSFLANLGRDNLNQEDANRHMWCYIFVPLSPILMQLTTHTPRLPNLARGAPSSFCTIFMTSRPQEVGVLDLSPSRWNDQWCISVSLRFQSVLSLISTLNNLKHMKIFCIGTPCLKEMRWDPLSLARPPSGFSSLREINSHEWPKWVC